MKFEALAPDLQAWLRQVIATGSSREDVLKQLRSAGYEKRFARDAVDLAFRTVPVPAPRPVSAPAPALVVQAGPLQTAAANDSEGQSLSQRLVSMPNTIATSDRDIQMLFALASPRVVLFANLLAPDECDRMIELARGKLERSSVVNTETGSYDVHPHRTSLGTHFNRGENEVVSKLENRIAELVQYPVERGEPIQILNYQPGGEYRPHHDYFDPAHPGNEQVLAHGGQRIATLIMYLSDVTAGGATVFPDIGLDVLPRRGNAVYFAYCAESGALDARTLHGGSPVGEGEKWIATKWFRERDYGGPGI